MSYSPARSSLSSISRSHSRSSMSLRQYFKARDGVPNPKGSLSSRPPSSAIASVNREVTKAI